MNEQNPNALLQKAKIFVKNNLFDLSCEVLRRQNGDILPCDSKFDELRKICSFAGHSAISVAESLVHTEALRKISEGV